MGLAVARHLAGKGWKICVSDLNEKSGESAAKELGGIFVKVDVTNYEEQAAAFQKTWETYGRIDFGMHRFRIQSVLRPLLMKGFLARKVYANAGIVDTYPFYSEQKDLPPPKPSLLVENVCLTGVIYSSYLAMHYMRRNAEKGCEKGREFPSR